MSLCRTCFDIREECDYVPIEGDLKDMLMFCIPELDLNITENPVLCKVCKSSVENVNEFKTKCLSTQKKIVILFTNRTSQLSNFEPPVVPTKAVKKVAPFKLKLKTKHSELPKISINNKRTESQKRRYSEVQPIKRKEKIKSPPASDPEDKDQEDFLNLLDNSDNVIHPKMESDLEGRSSNNLHSNKSQDDKPKKWECNLCNKTYSTKGAFNSHKVSSVLHKMKLAKMARGVQLYKCENCPFITKYQIGLNKHYPLCPKKGIGSGISKIDNYSVSSTGALGKQRFSCKICSQGCPNKGSLVLHMSRTHKIMLYKCDRCNFQAPSKKKLESHKATHKNHTTNDFPCKFEGCHRTFLIKKAFEDHQASHLGLSKNKCNECSREFSTSRGLIKHLTSHKKQEAPKLPKSKSKVKVRLDEKASERAPDGEEILSPKTKTESGESEAIGEIPPILDRMPSLAQALDQAIEDADEESDGPEEAEGELEQQAEIPANTRKSSDGERPLFTVDYVGTVNMSSDNEDEMQDETEDHQSPDIEADSPNGQPEDDEMEILSQETIIMSQQLPTNSQN